MATLNVHFRIPYSTVWGQNVRVVGELSVLGSRDAFSAPRLNCRHAGDELVWEGSVTLPRPAQLTYRYAVVNESQGLDDFEPECRTIELPNNLPAAADVVLFDEWQARRRLSVASWLAGAAI